MPCGVTVIPDAVKFRLVKILDVVGLLAPFVCLAQTGILITAFTNPVPSAFAEFGWSVATVGNDRVLVGAPADDTGAENAGAAYLFNTNGTLLLSFTNPVPKMGAQFGEAMSAMGNNRVIIGARFADGGGAAYLFDTNANLLTTFTNPTPSSVLQFGSSVAALGRDRVLIGAQGYQLSIPNSGAAFLFSTNGILLTTITNPIPGDNLFGHSVAVVFNDKLLVGAPQTDPYTSNPGGAYLFNTNGTLLMNFTDSNAPNYENYGWSMVALGNDRVLISASSGTVYLFNTNAAVLASFTDPNADPSAQFGSSIAAVDTNQVLIGAPDDNVQTRSGTVFLFSTNGNTLATFTNPTAIYLNLYLGFGSSLAVFGDDLVLAGSPGDNTGAMNTGAAYLFSIPPPLLQIRLTATNQVAVSWPSPAPRCALQENTNGLQTSNWSNVTNGIQDDGTNHLFMASPVGNAFFRLFRP